MGRIKEVLQQAEDQGMLVFIEGEKLKIRGRVDIPDAENIAQLLIDNKEEVIEIKNQIIRENYEDESKELIQQLKKGQKWFDAVDNKLWDKKGDAITGTELEEKMVGYLAYWIQKENTLRDLYKYKGCIYDEGKCPTELYPKCKGDKQ